MLEFSQVDIGINILNIDCLVSLVDKGKQVC